MNLKDGSKKMSKSDQYDNSRINLSDDPTVIYNKIIKCKTDSIKEIYYDENVRPEVSNLIKIYQSLSDLTIDKIELQYKTLPFKVFKEDLAELIIKEIYPIHLKAKDLMDNKDYLN